MVAGCIFNILSCVSRTFSIKSIISRCFNYVHFNYASIKSTATINYLLDVLIKSIYYLNPNQTAVIGFNQLLHALAIQWCQPTAYVKQKLVLMLGALHIEMVMLSCLGDQLQDSGWTVALSKRWSHIFRKQFVALRSRCCRNQVYSPSNCINFILFDDHCIWT